MQHYYCLLLCLFDGVLHYYCSKNAVDLLEESSCDAGQVAGECREEARSLTNLFDIRTLYCSRGIDPLLDERGNGLKQNRSYNLHLLLQLLTEHLAQTPPKRKYASRGRFHICIVLEVEDNINGELKILREVLLWHV